MVKDVVIDDGDDHDDGAPRRSARERKSVVRLGKFGELPCRASTLLAL
jgi:hypothetical protein